MKLKQDELLRNAHVHGWPRLYDQLLLLLLAAKRVQRRPVHEDGGDSGQRQTRRRLRAASAHVGVGVKHSRSVKATVNHGQSPARRLQPALSTWRPCWLHEFAASGPSRSVSAGDGGGRLGCFSPDCYIGTEVGSTQLRCIRARLQTSSIC